MNSILRSISFMVLLSEIFASNSRFSHQKCGLYGMPPCSHVPSSFGVTPLCAGPSKTYCEFAPNYPTLTIRLLLEKWGIDNVNDLIVDETVDDFEATRFNDIPLFDQKPPNPHQIPFTEPPNAVPTDGFPPHNDGGGGGGGYNYPNPNNVHTPAPPAPPPPVPTPGYLPTNGYTVNHNPRADRLWSGFSYAIQQRPTYNNNHLLSEPYRFEPQHASNIGYFRPNPYVTEYNPAQWFKRYVRDVHQPSPHRFPRQVASNTSESVPQPTKPTKRIQALALNRIEWSKPIDPNDGRRSKRQNSGRDQLCQTTYQYITPQAALNSQGNWMYIVNQVDTTRQLVRTETCASSVCSNICQLPNGYSSRCEQKYVQKRLIALNADGTNLYTDTFWFPSCCACTIAGPT